MNDKPEEMRVMLVDDEESFLRTTRKLFERKGIYTVTAMSGAEALEKLVMEEIHVVIMDVNMPGMDGVTALKAVKSRFPLVEVIMFTGHASVESATEGLMIGATDYLTKPFDIDELISKVEDAFARRRFQEEKIRISRSRVVREKK